MNSVCWARSMLPHFLKLLHDNLHCWRMPSSTTHTSSAHHFICQYSVYIFTRKLFCKCVSQCRFIPFCAPTIYTLMDWVVARCVVCQPYDDSCLVFSAGYYHLRRRKRRAKDRQWCSECWWYLLVDDWNEHEWICKWRVVTRYCKRWCRWLRYNRLTACNWYIGMTCSQQTTDPY